MHSSPFLINSILAKLGGRPLVSWVSRAALPLLALALLPGCDFGSESDSSAGPTEDFAVDFPTAYVVRDLIIEEDEMVQDDILEPAAFNPGAKLMLKARASAAARPRDLLDGLFADDEEGNPARYDVKDLAVSSDGQRLLFSLRNPEDPDADEDEQPTWNIWEYDLSDDSLRRVIDSDLSAEEGEDIAPQYLPDGSIVFASTRQKRAAEILLDEGKPKFSHLDEEENVEAFSLHRMSATGDNIVQLTFNQSHDLAPYVRKNGKIMFLRWDDYGSREEALSLYQMNQNGSQVEPLYGYHSQETGTDGSEGIYFKPRELEDGRVLVTLRQQDSNNLGGDLVAVDVENFIAESRPIVSQIDIANNEDSQQSLTVGDVITGAERGEQRRLSPHGTFSSGYPLQDGSGRILVAWNNCVVSGVSINASLNAANQLINGQGQFVDKQGDAVEEPITLGEDEEPGVYPCPIPFNDDAGLVAADPLFGLWLYDAGNQSQSPVVISELGKKVSEGIIMEPRTRPEAFVNTTDPDLRARLDPRFVGAVNIRSVYDFDGVDLAPQGLSTQANPELTPTDERLARFIRLSKAVSLPDDDLYDFDNIAFGQAGQQRLKEILGYVEVQPDGSAYFEVPAEVAFTLDVLNAKGERIVTEELEFERHENWLQVQRGEVLQCTGCHTEDSEAPHGRQNAQAASINAGANGIGPFPGTQLVDEFGTPQPLPELAETMAEYLARLEGPDVPSVNLEFTDRWTIPADEEGSNLGAPIFTSYLTLSTASPLLFDDCADTWSAKCRITINYLEHIQPLWDAPREADLIAGDDGALENATCTSCHTSIARDEAGNLLLPAGQRQLDLTADVIPVQPTDFVVSFEELFNDDVEQEIIEDRLVDKPSQLSDNEGNLLFQADDGAGNVVPAPIDTELVLLLDENGAPLPFPVDPQPLIFQALMDSDGAAASADFFAIFDSNAASIDHRAMLSDDELKLIREWVDNGGQYYNDLFKAPEN